MLTLNCKSPIYDTIKIPSRLILKQPLYLILNNSNSLLLDLIWFVNSGAQPNDSLQYKFFLGIKVKVSFDPYNSCISYLYKCKKNLTHCLIITSGATQLFKCICSSMLLNFNWMVYLVKCPKVLSYPFGSL